MRLVARGLAGERGGEIIFSDVEISLGEGEGLVVTGPNGSGKSTMLRVIAGLLEPAEGEVLLEAPTDEFPTLEAAQHYLGHQNAMKPALTVRENLDFWQSFQGHEHMPVAEALEMVGLETIGHLPFGYLSTGQRRRIAIAKLLVSYRPIWLLDEPTAGLDKASERQFAALMEAHMEDGGMIIAATHIPLGLDKVRSFDMGEHTTRC
ncbi:heme ABC exporter ATP-binding protein CcmA [Zhengella mangrovi]|uniref:Heme ABC exporter ATP-binding protein CcmA n=1 Tax=Zhengella mangrovi TaxID=1982044 RepID=A0A2G1QSQ6_9HYPH|nr:heme ABC exporter ATP-binding protein CcmA [Zhengella mangrovi]PHP68563.1 heme ABC exporter ATP-binding protein CcmA [Zhengella mangrovi]